jgi:hypothetical protein
MDGYEVLDVAKYLVHPLNELYDIEVLALISLHPKPWDS